MQSKFYEQITALIKEVLKEPLPKTIKIRKRKEGDKDERQQVS